MERTKTSRGFALINFFDANRVPCTIQKSSIATDDLIWLGTQDDRMHLTKEMAAALIKELSYFVEHGELNDVIIE